MLSLKTLFTVRYEMMGVFPKLYISGEASHEGDELWLSLPAGTRNLEVTGRQGRSSSSEEGEGSSRSH